MKCCYDLAVLCWQRDLHLTRINMGCMKLPTLSVAGSKHGIGSVAYVSSRTPNARYPQTIDATLN